MNLRSKMALSFGTLFAVVLILVSLARTFGIPFTKDPGSYGDARGEVLRELGLVADLTKGRLSLWLSERRADARAIAENGPVELLTANLLSNEQISAVGVSASERREHFLTQPDCRALIRQLNTFLRSYKVYKRILIADASTGVIAVCTDEGKVGESIALTDFFSAALADPAKSLLDLEISSATDGPTLVLAHAIRTGRSKNTHSDAPVGLLIMHVDIKTFLKPLLKVEDGLGSTGEIVLFDRDMRILFSPRHPLSDGSTTLQPGYRIQTKAAQLAAAGEEGVVTAADYRGERVLAAHRTITISPTQSLNMVVKRDEDEVLAPLNRRVVAASLISLLGILSAAGVATLIARRIAGPVDRLTRVAKQVAAGDLDARVGPVAEDELGHLTVTFDSMVDRIRNWQEELEKKVTERTAALTAEIAERERAERALRASEERFDLAVRGASDGIWDWFDLSGDSAWFSPRFSEMLGWPEGKGGIASVSHLAGLVHPDDVDGTKEALRTHLEDGQPYDLECRLRTPSGQYRWFRIRGEALRDARGAPVRMAGSLQDITDRKRAQEERELLIEELESKNAELERFTYTVSHDLSSPLITIKTFVGFVQDDLREGAVENLHADLDRINRAAEKMSELLDQLLELSRIGRVVNPPTEVRLTDLVEEAVELLAAPIAERGVDIQIGTDLPTVYGDRARLLEVIQNLVENAVKFMGDQPSPMIEIGTAIEDDVSFVYVRDNGSGIDPVYQEKIFGLFDKLDQAVPGTGIGLALVRRIVEVHGGRIWLKSQGKGHGATFCFTLDGESGPERSGAGGNDEG